MEDGGWGIHETVVVMDSGKGSRFTDAGALVEVGIGEGREEGEVLLDVGVGVEGVAVSGGLAVQDLFAEEGGEAAHLAEVDHIAVGQEGGELLDHEEVLEDDAEVGERGFAVGKVDEAAVGGEVALRIEDLGHGLPGRHLLLAQPLPCPREAGHTTAPQP